MCLFRLTLNSCETQPPRAVERAGMRSCHCSRSSRSSHRSRGPFPRLPQGAGIAMELTSQWSLLLADKSAPPLNLATVLCVDGDLIYMSPYFCLSAVEGGGEGRVQKYGHHLLCATIARCDPRALPTSPGARAASLRARCAATVQPGRLPSATSV